MSDPKITVRIDSSRPIFVEADASAFGQIFAGLNDHEQVDVLRSMVEHMKPHKMQWDYIAMALEKDENSEVRDDLSVIFPATNTMLERIAALEAENERLRKALEEAEETLGLVQSKALPDPRHHDQVKELGKKIGFGALMSTAEAGWREVLEEVGLPFGGEFVSGPCRSTVDNCLSVIRAALEAKA
jgi:hypothetical protein